MDAATIDNYLDTIQAAIDQQQLDSADELLRQLQLKAMFDGWILSEQQWERESNMRSFVVIGRLSPSHQQEGEIDA